MNAPAPITHIFDLPERSEKEQRAFFTSVLERTLAAEARAGVEHHTVELAGVRIRLCFASERLASILMPALRHLEVPAEGPADACFHIWDSVGSGIAMVDPPCPVSSFTDRGDIWGFSSRTIRSAFHWGEAALNLMDMETGEAVCWFDSAGHLPYWTAASPFRTLFHWLMASRGAQLLHAACVGTEAGGILITGKGGAGKSTTALACLDAGLSYVSDDYLVLRLDPEPRAFSLYCTAKLDSGQIGRFPRLRDLLADPNPATDEKAIFYLHPAHAGLLARSLPVRLHATPNFRPCADSRFAPIAPGRLHAAAAFTTISQLPHAGYTTDAFIARLIAEVPGMALELGHDIARIPETLVRTLRAPVPVAAMRGEASQPVLPLVTVVIPVHNGATFLGEAVASILRQNYPALEIIVVDDGSSDAIEAAVQALPVKARFFRQKQAGPAVARNRGILDASGEVLAFLDVDDLWPDNMLMPLVELLRSEPDIMVAKGFGQLMRVAENGEVRYLGGPAEAYPYYIGSAVYRRETFGGIGLFDKELRFGEDTDWFNRLHEKGLRMERLDQVTLLVRRHDNNMTRGKSLIDVNVLRVFKKMLDRQRLVADGTAADQQ